MTIARKKGMINAITLALTLINLVLTIVMVFVFVPAINKTSNLVDKICTIIDLNVADNAESDKVDVSNLDISLELNGEVKQKGNTNMMMFSPRELVSFVSGIMTLLPGDVITTGTPAGIGPMDHGDKVSVVIESIGTLTNYMK